METIIQEVTFYKEKESQFGKMYTFKVKYDDKLAFYTSKCKDQNKFIAGQKAEFTEEEKGYTDNHGNPATFWVIKPVTQNRQSNFGKALKKEQSRYSGFAMAYAKDLVVAGKITPEQMYAEAQCMMDWMVETDKKLEL